MKILGLQKREGISKVGLGDPCPMFHLQYWDADEKRKELNSAIEDECNQQYKTTFIHTFV